jgi:DNA ligase-1
MSKEKQFKPILAPNQEVDLDEIDYPIYASRKLDGIRCVIHPDLGIVSRSLKPIPNKQLNERLQPLLEKAKEYNVILDGELYRHGLTFQEVTRAVMTEDITDIKTIKKIAKEKELDISKNIDEETRNKNLTEVKLYLQVLVHKIRFNMFDCITNGDYEEYFVNRQMKLNKFLEYVIEDKYIHDYVPQIDCYSKEDVEEFYKKSLDVGYEGLILRKATGKYKYGRGTLNEGIIYKVKPIIELSGKIIGVDQATVVNPDAEKTTNELGFSVTSKKKGDRVIIEKASNFVVEYERDGKTHVIHPPIVADDSEKKHIWENREDYIGCEVLVKGMDIGAKDVMRIPRAIRWWLKDE